METIIEKLKEYLENTPEERILSDWDKSKEFDSIGITIDEFIKSQQDIDPDIHAAINDIYWSLLDNDEV